MLARCGLPNTLRGQLRHYALTTLANTPGMNPSEIARTARHKSLTSQAAYIRVNRTSEVNRASALTGVLATNAPKTGDAIPQPSGHGPQPPVRNPYIRPSQSASGPVYPL